MTTLHADALWLPMILALPLGGAVTAYVFGLRRAALAGRIATAASALAFAAAICCAVLVNGGLVLEWRGFQWIAAGDLRLDFALRCDALTAVMGLVVTGVGTLIHLFAMGYMAADPGQPRFFAYLNLFMFAMLLLVLAASLPVMFAGWEGVGLCSYLLIGFWYRNSAFAAAGRKAFLFNRVGDAGFLLGIFLIFGRFGTLDFAELAGLCGAALADPGFMTLVALCLFVGAAGKSAQIPLFAWLPDAMAGPTPVSALIHAATMVTAGVYMMARLSFIYAAAPLALGIVSWIAVLTALLAASIAMLQTDIKKVLAYSTISQLGFMFMAASAGAHAAAVFHLVTHSFFKGCLFLCAGSVIHACHHEQDMRHLGGLRRRMPWTFLSYLFATLAISGLFPFAGYFSKHEILAALAHAGNPELAASLPVLVPAAMLAAVLAAFYMTRSLAMTFLGEYRGHGQPSEVEWRMRYPAAGLAALSLLGGVVLLGGFDLPGFLGRVVPQGAQPQPALSWLSALEHSWAGFLGLGLGLLFYTSFKQIPGRVFAALGPAARLAAAKYYIDEIYRSLIVQPLYRLSVKLWQTVDQGWIDGTFNGAGTMAEMQGDLLRLMHTGQVRHYAFQMLVWIAVICGFYLAI